MNRLLYAVVVVLAVACFVLSVAACAPNANASPSAEQEIVIEKLFTQDGCTVSHFHVNKPFNTYNGYFTRCENGTAQVSQKCSTQFVNSLWERPSLGYTSAVSTSWALDSTSCSSPDGSLRR